MKIDLGFVFLIKVLPNGRELTTLELGDFD